MQAAKAQLVDTQLSETQKRLVEVEGEVSSPNYSIRGRLH